MPTTSSTATGSNGSGGFSARTRKLPSGTPWPTRVFDARLLGINLPQKPARTAAILIPSVGCPVGCNFCSTSALFGGKGKFLNFYETGDELYSVMCQIEEKLAVRSFFVLDENFLLHRKRTLRLLELMEKNGKSWALNVFSSARVLQSYSIEQLVGLGIIWVWMGLEGESSAYKKIEDVETKKLVRTLQENGICVLGSSIIGLENHTPLNMDGIIDHAEPRHRFSPVHALTPNPGTLLHEQHRQDGTLPPESEFHAADAHGQ